MSADGRYAEPLRQMLADDTGTIFYVEHEDSKFNRKCRCGHNARSHARPEQMKGICMMGGCRCDNYVDLEPSPLVDKG